MIKNRQISKNFYLYEFLESSTAQRFPKIMKQQFNPPESVVDAIVHQVNHVWQPIRDWFNCSFIPNSGYRSKELNKLVGSSNRSQHLLGEATDMELSVEFINDHKHKEKLNFLRESVKSLTGKPVRPNVNPNYYLFAYACMNLDKLDIDQVIHEFGTGKGSPAWIHISSSARQNSRQILIITNSGSNPLSLKEALLLGC